VPIQEIVRIEADGSYSMIYTEESKHLSSRRLGYYEKKLEGYHFFRCHNSHLINLDFLDKIGKSSSGYLKMKNGETIPFASSKRNQLNQLLGL
jgi:two-component system LytT family response regulator